MVRPGGRVGYVPTAVLLCRVAALREVGGFDSSLRYGEDVDLVWRLVAAGWTCRYEPGAEAEHDARPSMPAWIRQRFGYGTAAAPLDIRHPGALAPARITRWSLAAWASAATGHVFVAATLGAVGSARLARRLTGADVPPGAAARVGAATVMHDGEQLADALISVWWPLALLGACASASPASRSAARVGRARRRRVGEAVGLASTRRGTSRSARSIAPRTAPGSWRGAIARRRPGPLVPRLG